MDQMDYHEDEEQRISGERHAGIVFREGKILLMHRIKKGFEYYVFPGGHRRDGDTGEDTVEREVYEETGIKVIIKGLAFTHEDTESGHRDFYYACEWLEGITPELMGDEKIRNSRDNFFEPMWVEADKVDSINILPEYAKDWLRDYLGNR